MCRQESIEADRFRFRRYVGGQQSNWDGLEIIRRGNFTVYIIIHDIISENAVQETPLTQYMIRKSIRRSEVVPHDSFPFLFN